jgi:hypothetical protein
VANKNIIPAIINQTFGWMSVKSFKNEIFGHE